ncbi:type II/IV secretion system protein, partial [candidate division KSB1 bacterium]
MSTTDVDQKLQLGQLLLKNGAITKEQLEEALQLQKMGGNEFLLGEILVQQKICTEEQIM